MRLEVKVPSVGESVTSAEIAKWQKKSGDFVKKGETLVILETDKASMDLPAKKEGLLTVIKKTGESVSVDEVIAFIDTEAGDAKPALNPEKSNKKDSSEALMSPAVRRLVETNELNPLELEGTGRGGRLTKGDILKSLAEADIEKPSPQNAIEMSELKKGFEEISSLSKDSRLRPGQRKEKMSRLRRLTAKRLVQSQQATASLSTFNEVDMSRIIEIRKSYQKTFVEKYGFKLGFMSFFVKSVVSALKKYPKINAFVEEDHIIYNDFQNIGIAVSTDQGLVVPVLFQAEKLSLAQIEKQIIEYRDKAFARKLSPDDLLGGTFTISNGGVFGSLLSTPILNPPQSGILGMHTIQERPVVVNGEIQVRPMMYVTLSYDHRVVDGRESVSFLVKVKEGLEDPSRLLIDL